MVLGMVIGHATATVKHPSLIGLRMPLVQVLDSNRKPEGDVLVAVDRYGAGQGQMVILSSDGKGRGNMWAMRRARRDGMSWEWSIRRHNDRGRMIFTARQLQDLQGRGQSNDEIVLPYGSRLTPLAVDWAHGKRLKIGYGPAEISNLKKADPVEKSPHAEGGGSCLRWRMVFDHESDHHQCGATQPIRQRNAADRSLPGD